MSSYTLVTIHRPFNCNPQTLKEVYKLQGRVIFPAHPRIRPLLNKAPGNFEIIEPVGYLEMLRLERDADLIVTDSGGVQREAYVLGKNIIVLRDTTEWPELTSGEKGLLGNGDAYKKCVDILCSII